MELVLSTKDENTELIAEIASYLVYTRNSIESVNTEFDIILTTEQEHQLEKHVFKCKCCGWWIPVEEESCEFDICQSCYDKNEDDEYCEEFYYEYE